MKIPHYRIMPKMITKIIFSLANWKKTSKNQKNLRVKAQNIQHKLKTMNKKMMRARMIRIFKHKRKNRSIVILLAEEKHKKIIN